MGMQKHGVYLNLRDVQRELRRSRRVTAKGSQRMCRKLHQIILLKADVG